jgi:serine protease Do
MKYKLIPVILTAAVTSVMTLSIVSHFQNNTPYFPMAASEHKREISYAALGSPGVAGGPANFEAAASTSVKAVVHIKSTINGRTITTNSNDMFSRMFGQQQYYIPPQQESGSGVVISADGYIVTNNHVVSGVDEVAVTFSNRYTTKAKVIGSDPGTDIAVLKVEGRNNLSYMEFGNSDEARLGQWVLAVGYPLTLDATVTAGIISAKGRSIGINRTQSASAIESFIQTDAAVNPGNSGGALVNTSGQLIGINSAIASPTGSYAGYSYAIPANIVRKAVNDLTKYGSVQRAYMGVEFFNSVEATPEQITELGLDKTAGVYLTKVLPKSGAAKAGLQKGDFITEINGQIVNNEPELRGQIAHFQPGDNITVTFLRDGKPNVANVQLTNHSGTTEIIKAQTTTKLLGASFRNLTTEERVKYNIVGGVVLTDAGKGDLAKHSQMQKGLIITNVNNNTVASVSDLEQSVMGSRSLIIAGFYPGQTALSYYQLNNVENVTKGQ